MLIAAVVLLALTVIALIGYLLTLEQGLRRAKTQMEQHFQNATTARLDIPCPNKAAEEMFAAVNRLLELRQEENASYRRKERELRRQITNVSHDLRTPLTSILGYLQLLEQPDLPPDKRAEYLSVIRGRARTLQT